MIVQKPQFALTLRTRCATFFSVSPSLSLQELHGLPAKETRVTLHPQALIFPEPGPIVASSNHQGGNPK